MRQSFALGSFQGKLRTFTASSISRIVREVKLIRVAAKALPRNVVEGSHDSALQNGEVALDRVGVDDACAFPAAVCLRGVYPDGLRAGLARDLSWERDTPERAGQTPTGRGRLPALAERWSGTGRILPSGG